MLMEQGPDLLPLLRGKVQVPGQMIEFLVDRPQAVPSMKHPTWTLERRSRFLRRRHAIADQCQHQTRCENGQASHDQILCVAES
jgi:hypothetical protein